MGCSDSRWSIPAAVSAIDEHNFDLDEYQSLIQARGMFFAERIGNHIYPISPLGVSIVAVPAVVVLRPVARLAFEVAPTLRATLESAQRARGCPPANTEAV